MTINIIVFRLLRVESDALCWFSYIEFILQLLSCVTYNYRRAQREEEKKLAEIINIYCSSGGLDRPIQRSFILRDWRFGHYEMEGLQDPFSRFITSIISTILWKKKKIRYIEDEDISYSLSC